MCWDELNIHGLVESCGVIIFVSPYPVLLCIWYFGRSSQSGTHGKGFMSILEETLQKHHCALLSLEKSFPFLPFTLIYWMGLGKMYVYLHKSCLSSGRCLPPTLELFREVGQVDTSAYPVKSRLPKRVKQMQRPPALKTKLSGSQNYCYWASWAGWGWVIYIAGQALKVFNEHNPYYCTGTGISKKYNQIYISFFQSFPWQVLPWAVFEKFST